MNFEERYRCPECSHLQWYFRICESCGHDVGHSYDDKRKLSEVGRFVWIVRLWCGVVPYLARAWELRAKPPREGN